MVKKATFRKQSFDFPMHQCFYCGERPTGILTFIKTGEEIRVCESCASKYRKIKKFKKSKGYAIPKEKETKITLNSLIKNSTNEVLIEKEAKDGK